MVRGNPSFTAFESRLAGIRHPVNCGFFLFVKLVSLLGIHYNLAIPGRVSICHTIPFGGKLVGRSKTLSKHPAFAIFSKGNSNDLGDHYVYI